MKKQRGLKPEAYNIYIPCAGITRSRAVEKINSIQKCVSLYREDNINVSISIIPLTENDITEIYMECTYPIKTKMPDSFLNLILNVYDTHNSHNSIRDAYTLAEHGWNPFLIQEGAFSMLIKRKNVDDGNTFAIIPNVYKDSWEIFKSTKTEIFYEDYEEWKAIIQLIPGIEWKGHKLDK